MSQLTIFRVDAFADRPFAGNAAAVCLLEAPVEDRWLQAVAREMNAPATAFVRPGADRPPLRWFSPTVELELCGHGTLATAHVLWEIGLLPGGAPARFTTRGGALAAARRDGWIEMDFPAEPPMEAAPPEALAEALGVKPRYARLGKAGLLAYQASARGGVVRVRPRGSRVLLGGRAVTVARAMLG